MVNEWSYADFYCVSWCVCQFFGRHDALFPSAICQAADGNTGRLCLCGWLR